MEKYKLMLVKNITFSIPLTDVKHIYDNNIDYDNNIYVFVPKIA